jgi:hypothetical protein
VAPKVGYAAAQDRVGKQPHPDKVQEHGVVGISGVDERPIPITDNVACAAAAYGEQEEIFAAEHEGERGRPPHAAINCQAATVVLGRLMRCFTFGAVVTSRRASVAKLRHPPRQHAGARFSSCFAILR